MPAGTGLPDILELAQQLWGTRNAAQSTPTDIRFGTNGSKSVRPKDRIWFDNEAGEGGGYVDLYVKARGERPDGDASILKTYDYHDADGRLIYQVVRKDGHKFLQRRPDGNGGWVWKMTGIKRVPYLLPELLRADPTQPVFVCEGEKDCDNLHVRGLVTTTNPGGAGKWLPHMSFFLRGRDVIILPDNDDVGEKHALDVAAKTRAIARSVTIHRLPGLPPKGDVSDWLGSGGTVAELMAIKLSDPKARTNGHANGHDKSHETDGREDTPSPGHQQNRSTDDPKFVWPAPLDFLINPNDAPPELRHEHIPLAINDFVFDTAERMGVDPSAVAIGGIVALASVATDDWKLQPKRFDYTWTENPRVWGAILGDPSILKTPVITACTRPIDKLDAEARTVHAEAMRIYKQQAKAAKADKTHETPEPVHPRLDRYLIEGATVEAISEVLRNDEGARQRAPARKVLSRHNEMGEFFANLDRYQAGGKGGGDRGAYLRLYDGGPYTFDRISRGAFSVPNWSGCFLGAMQPGPIQKIAKNATEDGTLQRFIFIVPGPQMPGLDRAPSQAALASYDALFPAMAGLHPPRTPDGHVYQVAFHEDAHKHRETVDVMARALAQMPDTDARLQAAFGKWPGMFARLALIFHLIEVAEARSTGVLLPALDVITEPTARCAAAFMLDIVYPHLVRADAMMFSSTQTGHAKWIAGHILAHHYERITSRDITRAYGALRAPECKAELSAVMDSLVTVGWLEPLDPNNSFKSVNAWAVNPSVHTMFAEKAQREQEAREQARADMAAVFAARKAGDNQ